MGHSGSSIDELFGLEKPKVEYVSYKKAFEEACPIFMSYGMSYDEFWHGDPCQTKYQLKAYKLQLKHEDECAWEQGMYIYEAIIQCAPILRPFSKAEKPLPYTEKPHLNDIDNVEQTEQDKQQEVENERLKAQIWINNWARSVQKHFENK